jgi:hypothetical protein
MALHGCLHRMGSGHCYCQRKAWPMIHGSLHGLQLRKWISDLAGRTPESVDFRLAVNALLHSRSDLSQGKHQS